MTPNVARFAIGGEGRIRNLIGRRGKANARVFGIHDRGVETTDAGAASTGTVSPVQACLGNATKGNAEVSGAESLM